MQVWCSGFTLKAHPQSYAVMEQFVRLAANRILRQGFSLELLAENTPWFLVRIEGEPLGVGDGFEKSRMFAREPDIIRGEPIIEHTGLYPDEIEPPSHFAPSLLTDVEWSLEQIHGKEAWISGGNKGDGIRIAHLDTGYTEHPELISNNHVRIDLGYNFEENLADPKEPLSTIDAGHGTATASVLVSPEGKQLDTPNDGYVSGIAPYSELVPIRVDRNVWFLSGQNDARGIYHALKQRCDVVSMSRGGNGGEVLKEAVDKAINSGTIIVAAASNCDVTCGVWDPASYPSVICVAGSTRTREPWKSSSRGGEVDIGAPAHLVFRARTTNQSGYYYDIQPSSGTSYATPLTAGTAALWLAKHGGRQALQDRYNRRDAPSIVFRYLLKTKGFSQGVNWDQTNFGPGILDANALVNADLPSHLEIQEFQRTLPAFLPSKPSERYRQITDQLFLSDTPYFGELYEEVGEELFFYIKFIPEINFVFEKALQQQKTLGLLEPDLHSLKESLLAVSPSPTLRNYLSNNNR